MNPFQTCLTASAPDSLAGKALSNVHSEDSKRVHRRVMPSGASLCHSAGLNARGLFIIITTMCRKSPAQQKRWRISGWEKPVPTSRACRTNRRPAGMMY